MLLLLPMGLSAENYTKVTIEEAFISRKTSLAFKDAHSAAEFGWKIYHQGKFIHRGGQLYATLYYPALPQDAFELRLIERDVFRDDLVAKKEIGKGSKHVLNKNGDFVILKRERFFAEGKSGPDQKISQSFKCKKVCKGRVSFRSQDKTDYLKLPATSASLFIASSKISPFAIVKGEATLLSGEDKNFRFKNRPPSPSYVYLSQQSGQAITVKLADKVAGYGFDYQIYSGNRQYIFNQALAFLKNKSSSWVEAKDLGRVMKQFGLERYKTYCAKLTAKQKKDLTYKNFCKALKK